MYTSEDDMEFPIVDLAATDPPEMVDHPAHYNQHPAGIECIDVIEELPFNLGTAIKYLWRAGLKPDTPTTQDLKKAVWYIEREIGRLQARGVGGSGN